MYKNIYRNNAKLEIQKHARPVRPIVSHVEIPKNFNWIQSTSDDNEYIKSVKNIILRPSNQASCGNCYAFSTSSVLSDLFVVKYGYKSNPDLSPSFMNINYPELGGCSGGDPVDALNTIYKKGLASNKCVDNSICLTNNDCNGNSNSHISDNRLNGLYQQIGTGCYTNETREHRIYYPAKSTNYSDEASIEIYPNYNDDLMKEIYHGYMYNIPEFIKLDGGRLGIFPDGWDYLPQSENEARIRIYKNGPAVGLCCVTSNFMDDFFNHDKFIDVFDGVFLDSVVWNKDGTYNIHDPRLVKVNNPTQDGPITFKGGHAVSIIGYGVSNKPIPIMDFSLNKIVYKYVPFWWVRNSWSTTWNPTGGLGGTQSEMGGCVKIAMYPFNKVLQFDVPIDQHTQAYAIPSRHTGYIYGLGGIVFTEAGDPPKLYEVTESNNYRKQHPDLSDSSNYSNVPYFYTFGSPNLEYSIPKNTSKNTSKHIPVVIIILIILIIVGVFYFYKRFKGK